VTVTAEVAGGLAALSSAFLFTVATALFQRTTKAVPAAGINLFKDVLAVVVLAMVVTWRGWQPLPMHAFTLLGLSGLLGITVGDTAYFLALSRLGARRTVLLDTLSPVITTLLAIVMLHEALGQRQWLGICMTLAGITTVMTEPAATPSEEGEPEHPWTGWLFGVASLCCHAGGVILSKQALAEVSSLDATLVRLGCSTLALLVAGLWGRRMLEWVRPLADRETLLTLICAAFLGTFLAMWLAQAALAMTQASLASTLNATGPIFVLGVARFGLGETVSRRAVLGALLAVAGAVTLLV